MICLQILLRQICTNIYLDMCDIHSKNNPVIHIPYVCLTPLHTWSQNWASTLNYVYVSKIFWMSGYSLDPDRKPLSLSSGHFVFLQNLRLGWIRDANEFDIATPPTPPPAPPPLSSDMYTHGNFFTTDVLGRRLWCFFLVWPCSNSLRGLFRVFSCSLSWCRVWGILSSVEVALLGSGGAG